MALSVVAIVILTSIVVYSADATGIPKKAISTVSRFIESDLPTTTLFTDVQNTITSIQQFTTTSAVFENPAKTFGTTLAGGAVTANRTLNLPVITGTDTVATLGLAQTFTGAQTINSLILGGDVNVGSNGLTTSGHKSTLPSTTGVICQTNQTGTCGGINMASSHYLVGQWDTESTKTNIGTSFVDVYTTGSSNGHAIQIDTNGFTKYQYQIIWSKVGSGTQTCQLVDIASGTNIMTTTASLASGMNTGSDTSIPAGLVNSIHDYKWQCKSTTAGDDPVFLAGRIWLKP